MYEREERCIQGCGEEMRERDHLKDLVLEVRIILEWILKK
jgi:hypothetical protein